MSAGALHAPTPRLDPPRTNSSKFVINAAPAPLCVIENSHPAAGLSTAEYLELLHPKGSRGHAFLSGPAPEKSWWDDGSFIEVIGGQFYWRDTRCALEQLPETGAAWAQDRSGRYVSMARFTGRRREVDLVEIGACWVDLDYYNLPRLAGWTPEQVLWLARDRLAAARIPAPGIVLRSGRGLLLVWLHDAIPAKALPRWKALQRKFHDALSGLGVDRSGLTPTKVFRIPGSANRDQKVRVLFPMTGGEVERWAFEDLCRETLPKTRRESDYDAADEKFKADCRAHSASEANRESFRRKPYDKLNFCSCFVSHETLERQTADQQGFWIPLFTRAARRTPPQPQDCKCKNRRILIAFFTKNAKKHANRINFRESVSIRD